MPLHHKSRPTSNIFFLIPVSQGDADAQTERKNGERVRSKQNCRRRIARLCWRVSAKMVNHIHSLGIVLQFLLHFILIGLGSAAPVGSCLAPSLQESLFPRRDTSTAADLPLRGNLGYGPPRVTELDEVSLERALNFLQKSRDAYIAVLFYASWCPFCKISRPTFDVLSSMFPTIHHVAVEEYALRPSVLSRYGVHSFPTIFLQNRTSRVRYQGSRKLESFVLFYKNIAGIDPVSPDFLTEGRSSNLRSCVLNEAVKSGKHCPYSWAKSPEKLLQQDTYLCLAILFLVLRMLHLSFPKVLLWIKRVWKRHVWPANVAILQENPPTFLEQLLYIFNLNRIRNGLKFCKTGNFQGGAMNARAWASTSLASVSLGEGSSTKISSGSSTKISSYGETR